MARESTIIPSLSPNCACCFIHMYPDTAILLCSAAFKYVRAGRSLQSLHTTTPCNTALIMELLSLALKLVLLDRPLR